MPDRSWRPRDHHHEGSRKRDRPQIAAGGRIVLRGALGQKFSTAAMRPRVKSSVLLSAVAAGGLIVRASGTTALLFESIVLLRPARMSAAMWKLRDSARRRPTPISPKSWVVVKSPPKKSPPLTFACWIPPPAR